MLHYKNITCLAHRLLIKKNLTSSDAKSPYG